MMTDQIFIRKANILDIDGLVNLEMLFNKEHNKFEHSAFRLTGFDKKLLKNNFLKKLKRKNKLFLVLEDSGIKGYFFGEISTNKMERLGYLHKGTKFGYIMNVFVLKKYRSQGVFREFTKQFFDFLKSKNVRYCELHVAEQNTPAIEAYKRYGFETVERRMRTRIR